MITLLSRISLVMFCFIITASIATATPIIDKNDYIQVQTWNHLNGGGIFTLEGADNSSLTINPFYYNTFCIQENVDIGRGTYKVADISDHLGLHGSELLNGKVDYIFAEYSLHKYDSSLTTPAEQARLQDFIWFLQGEITYKPNSSDPWVQDLKNNYHPGESFGTEVLNLVHEYKNKDGVCVEDDVQNMLYYHVPEPSTILLLGIGLLGVSIIMKKIGSSPYQVGKKISVDVRTTQSAKHGSSKN